MMDAARLGRRVARVAAASVLVVLVLLLALTLPFAAYAAITQDEDRREAAPTSGRFVQAADVEVFVQERGPTEGPPVLLVHGTGAWSGFWGETMDALAAEGYRAIALDLPPFGYSERPADGAYGTEDQARRLLGVVDALGLPRVTLVAHSFGSRAGMEAVLAESGRFERVVLVDAALALDGPGGGPPLVRGLLAVPPVRSLLVSSTLANPLLTKTLLESLVHNDSAATPERVDILQRPMVVEGSTRAGGKWLRAFLAPEAPLASGDPAAYARLDVPLRLVWGAEDDVTPVARGEAIARLVPGARLDVLPGVGHIPQVEDPPAFQAALLRALRD